MNSAAARETDHLTLQQKISEQSARLTAENNTLKNKLQTDLADYEVTKDRLMELEKDIVQLVSVIKSLSLSLPPFPLPLSLPLLLPLPLPLLSLPLTFPLSPSLVSHFQFPLSL